ncbi:ATP-binding protein [Streptomyces sp. NPDC058249]|uniref:HAMP domain-containing sensor histidine kinase n=1 Tax=Streptomyces sp. NPDC058249 TaxID=3346403 RepID=UPI0036E870FD
MSGLGERGVGGRGFAERGTGPRGSGGRGIGKRASETRGTGSRGSGEERRGASPWGGVRPFSIKTKLGFLVVVSVLITTGLLMIAVRTETELRFITVFSMIATLLITQFVAHSLTAPLGEMNAVARSISHGDYTRRVSDSRRDELGDLAGTINLMADELEAQDRQRKELVANVSHELRTPIAGLRAVLENVVDGVSAADPETMRTALKQTERLGRLVETLLDLSRLDNGVVPLRKRRFEVWPYLSGVLKEANMVASARAGIASGSGSHTRTDVHLHLDVSPPELTAHADPERIHQVVANLIDNAVKHSPPHGRVTVKARRGDYPESLALEVLDEGPGIPKSEWHRVFERFNRGGVPSPHGPGSDGGTGLGLAIARWAVDLHGGRIAVAESQRGCRIQVTLPGLPSLPS